MKGLKVLAIVFAAAAVLLVVVVVLAFTPGVQTWAVRRAVADQPGMKIEIGRVAAGLSDGQVSDLKITKDGMVITAKSAVAKYALTELLTKKRLNADKITVEDLVVDLRNATPSANASATPAGSTTNSNPAGPTTRPAPGSPGPRTPAAPAQKFEGLLAKAELPLDVRVADASVKGRALLPKDQSATFDLKATGIETGQRGKVDWTVDFTDATKAAPLQSLHTTGTAAVQIGTDRRITLVDANATAVAKGPNLPADPLKLEAKAEQAAGGSENYVARVGLMRGGNFEPLVTTNAQYKSGEINGTWEVAVRTEQLGALLSGLNLPTVSARGTGKFGLQPDTAAVNAAGTLQGQVSRLEKFSPELAAIGNVQFATTFDGGLADNVARLDRLELGLTSADGKKLADINTLQRVTYDLTAKRATLANPQSQLGRIAVSSLPLAWAQPFVKALTIERGELSLTLSVETDNTGSHVQIRSVDPVAIRNVTLRQGNKPLVEQATLTLRPTIDYSAARVTAELADISLTLPAGDALTGTAKADITNLATKPAIAFTTQLQAKTVAALKPYSPVDPGPLAVAIGSEGKFENASLQLARASLTANRADGSLLAAVEILQPIQANFDTQRYTVPNPNAAAARVKLGEAPLAWANAFVPNSKFDGVIASGAMELSFRTVDDVSVHTVEPVVLRGATATMDGKPLVQGLDVTADLTAGKRGQEITYDVRRLDVKQGQASLADVNVAGQMKLGGKMNVVAKGKLDADVAALMRQPVLAPYASLTRGRFAAVFEANLTDVIQAKAVLSGRDFVAREKNQALGNLDATLVASMKADGSGTISLPVTLTNANRKSDIAIEGTFGRTAKNYLFDGKVTSNELIVDDFQPFAALAPASPAQPAQPPPASRPQPGRPGQPAPTQPASKRDAQPFWSGVNGKLVVNLKEVRYGQNPIQGIHGTATITDGRLGLDGLEGKFKENVFKVAGGLAFNAQQPKPYQLTGTADFANIDVGELLRAANPSERPAMETKVTVSAKLNGNGLNIGDLAQNAYGTFDVSGTKGVLRALGKKGQTVGAVSSIIGIIGAARGSDTTSAIAQLTSYLNEISFDTFKMHVERGEDLNLKVSQLEIVSPEIRLGGTGSLQKQGDTPIQNQPMQIELQLAAKEGLALLLNKAGLLANKQDDKGYYLMSRTFVIKGTPAKTDASILWQIIGQAAASSFLGR